MTDKPLDSYIKSPPPADERSHFQYLEDQLSKLETVSKAHVTGIEDSNEQARAWITEEYTARVNGDEALAQYVRTVAAETLGMSSAMVQQETTARTTATTALASQITTLNANVGTLSGAITNESSIRISENEALASRIDNLVLTNGSSAAVIIDEEASARIAADYLEASKRLNLSAYVGYTDGQTYPKTLAASISDESSARVQGDVAVAQRVTYLGAGTNRVFVQTDPPAGGSTSKPYYQATAPANTGRTIGDVWYDTDDGRKMYVWAPSTIGGTDYGWQNNFMLAFNTYIGRIIGDVWYDSNDDFRPYVWCPSIPSETDYTWRDNSDGRYSSYIGQFASINQQFYAIYDTSNNTSIASQLSTVTAIANKPRVYRQTTAPTGTAGQPLLTGDLWLDTDDNNKSYYWNGSNWLDTSDVRLGKIVTIYRQPNMPTGAVVGDMWYDTDDNNKLYYWNGTSWLETTDLSRASVASVQQETTARANADNALARYLMSASAGTARVYTSDPGTSGRQNGDVWIKPEDSFKQFVWYNGAWRDNSDGSYSQYIGILANVTSTSSAAYSTASSAQTAANAATTIANQANSTAGTASNTANNANSIASTAQNIANTAQNVANLAKGTADNAKTTADSASATAISASNQVNSLSSQVTDGLNNANSRIDTVSATVATNNSALNTRIDNLTTTVTNNNNTLSSTVSNIQTTATSDRNTFAGQISSLQSIVGNGVGGGVTLTQSLTTTASKADQALSDAQSATNAANSVTTTASNAQSTANSAASTANSAVTTANAAASTANNLSYEWRVQGTIDGVTGGLRLAGAKRVNQSTGQVENTTNLIIDANTTINGNLVVNGTISSNKIAENAVTTSGYASASGSCSTTVTVRPRARVQVLANVKASSSYTSIQWAPVANNVNNGTYVLVNGSWQVKNLSDYTPSSTVSSKATLRITTPAGSDDTDILGAYNGSISDVQIGATVINGVLCAVYERRYTTMIYATTAVNSWFNPSYDTSVPFTFSAQSLTTGATVSLYVTELSK